ncbi:3473_t:CDS:1, partial [Dentiscutata heterogama]
KSENKFKKVLSIAQILSIPSSYKKLDKEEIFRKLDALKYIE